MPFDQQPGTNKVNINSHLMIIKYEDKTTILYKAPCKYNNFKLFQRKKNCFTNYIDYKKGVDSYLSFRSITTTLGYLYDQTLLVSKSDEIIKT